MLSRTFSLKLTEREVQSMLHNLYNVKYERGLGLD